MASFKQYRAPTDNDTALVDPPWPEQLDRLASPAALPEVTVGGVALARLATAARRDLVEAAHQYTASYTDVADSNKGPLVVSGHQPDLFHPGVWFKNFALDALAKASGGVGVHLLIDSDACREVSVRTPSGSVESPRSEAIPYDTPADAIPYEEREVQNSTLFEGFADRVAATVGPLVDEPLVRQVWPQAIDSLKRHFNVGRILSETRHRLEQSWGSKTLELPFSQAADSEGFRRFAAELLLRAEPTALAYNEALTEYREAHRLRNTAQPLPDLLIDGRWIETPFWAWSATDPTRRALFARIDSERLTLSDRHGWSAEGPTDADGAVAWLAELRRDGMKVRSRALATTLYCRLVLADQFLHGIGGAKYDQVTDRFSERLLGVVPSPHATLTATLRLPIDHAGPSERDRLVLVKRLRDLRYHPEAFLTAESSTELHAIAERKSHWLKQNDPADRAERHQQITAANEQISAGLAPQRLEAEHALADLRLDLRDAALLDSREHSFCLFPADDLRRRLTRLSTI